MTYDGERPAGEFHFTSESVTEGHPDKMADQISDAVLDAILREDPYGRVACETFVTTGLALIGGEISTSTYVDIPRIVREKIAEIGYDRAEYGFDAKTCSVILAVDEQSPDIAQGVDVSYEAQHEPGEDDPLDKLGAGDQGMMFGYACRETDELMPLPITLAHKICKRLAEVRHAEELNYLRPDGKAQVTVRYEVDEHGHQRPVEIERVLISTQHADGIDSESLIKPDLVERVLRPILPRDLYDEGRLEHKDFVYVNPTGRFVVGGPMGDTGPDRAQDHRRHVRRRCASRRRRLLGEGPDEGGPFGRLRRASRGEEHRRRRARRSLRAPGRLCHRHRAAVLDPGRVLRHRGDPGRAHSRAGRRALRSQAGSHPARPRPAPPDLREDRGVRALRPRRPRLHLGADRQGRRASRSPRASPASHRPSSDGRHRRRVGRVRRRRDAVREARAHPRRRGDALRACGKLLHRRAGRRRGRGRLRRRGVRRLPVARDQRRRRRADRRRPVVLLGGSLRRRHAGRADDRHAAERVRGFRPGAFLRRACVPGHLPREHPARPSASRP